MWTTASYKGGLWDKGRGKAEKGKGWVRDQYTAEIHEQTQYTECHSLEFVTWWCPKSSLTVKRHNASM